MFVPTIKYKKVNDEKDKITSVVNSTAPTNPSIHPTCSIIQQQANTNDSPSSTKGADDDSSSCSQTSNEPTVSKSISQKDKTTITATTATATTTITTLMNDISLEEKDDATITVDPSDDERILITLSDGKTQYTADRYCPHAGADLSYLGQVDEDEYPPEIGPILVCSLHYWEFALKRAGRGANGVATINACPFSAAEGDGQSDGVTCHAKNKLDW
ncbi:hypothetical protein BCR42DRAFT_415095 [Absidia repens]|uniref:Rieske domain-containing protein n=1 Tax=Absidia repens TaxID=90262 RepID=A0A1X2IHA8_9FUNG|nr:hypothetical protein BCR42DRAFT_415095 [Absidia repens]